MKKICSVLAVAMMTVCMVSCGNDEAIEPVSNNDGGAIQTIMNRKSVRSYNGEPIPQETMESMLKAAMAAPSGRDVRPWHIVVMDDKTVYDELFEGNHNMEKFKQSGAVVIFCADTTVTRPSRENPDAEPETRPNALWRDDMGACVENFLLAVEYHGLGAVWTSCYPYTDRMEPIRKYLDLPGNVVPYAVVPVGVPAGDEQPKDKWDTTRVHYNRW